MHESSLYIIGGLSNKIWALPVQSCEELILVIQAIWPNEILIILLDGRQHQKRFNLQPAINEVATIYHLCFTSLRFHSSIEARPKFINLQKLKILRSLLSQTTIGYNYAFKILRCSKPTPARLAAQIHHTQRLITGDKYKLLSRSSSGRRYRWETYSPSCTILWRS